MIDRECDEAEILLSRKKLFTFFNDVQCDKQKKPVIDIIRGSKRKNIEDIVGQMLKVDKSVQSNLFFMPWDFVLKTFKSDTENVLNLLNKNILLTLKLYTLLPIISQITWPRSTNPTPDSSDPTSASREMAAAGADTPYSAILKRFSHLVA